MVKDTIKFLNNLNESTQYNTKSKDEFETIDDYKSAIHDDISVIRSTIEDLKHKMNTDESVEILNSYIDKISSDILSKAYN